MALGPGALCPRLASHAIYLGTVLSFERVPGDLQRFARVHADGETVRALTEAAGAVAETLDAETVAELEATAPAPPLGPACQQVSGDGAMVPLVGGTWAEVKTLAIGTVVRDAQEDAHTRDLSYFSRLTDAATFGRLVTSETHRRGTETAGVVVAVQDGAEWLQGVIDLQRPDAVRILDFPHAAEHLATAAKATWGEGTAAVSEWLGVQLHTLKHGDPEDVLRAVLALPAERAVDPATAIAVREATHGYLAKRREQIQYARFRAAGYPIGSGCVESANKLVVEARLKGSGRRWTRDHVNPLLALRTRWCSGRWDEEWPTIWHRLRRRWRDRPRPMPPSDPPAGPDTTESDEAPPEALDPETPAPAPAPASPTIPGRHPWRAGPACIPRAS